MKNFLQALILLTFALGFTFCGNKNQNSGLKESSHDYSTQPNYSVVFPDDKVNRIDIKIEAEMWAEMQADLKSNISGNARKMMPPPDRNMREGIHQSNHSSEQNSERNPVGSDLHRQHKRESNKQNAQLPPSSGRMGPPPGGRPGGAAFEPTWSRCTINFNNEKWENVGIRFKGNSSLRTTYQNGIKKLSFKIDFDRFEDEFPEIKNQRFYGFKQLNLKNNFDDPSFIREKVASDLFTEFGLISPKTAFYRVFVDYGEGPVYFGLYTLVEEVDDTVIKTTNKNNTGNLYKPEGLAATFAKGSFRTTDMNKKNNRKSDDFSDVEQLSTILNSSLRDGNPELWKTQLSEIFDVPVFLKWLAANTVMQNWDSYGKTFHNYYLYNNPSVNKLQWIPWDNNEALQEGKMGGALSLGMTEIDDRWPLIRNILDDKQWYHDYKSYVSTFVNEVFTVDKMTSVYNSYQNLLSNDVIGSRGEIAAYTFLKNKSDFNDAIHLLKQQVVERKKAVEEFLTKNNE